MHGLIESARGGKAIAIVSADSSSCKRIAQKLGKTTANWVQASGFGGEPGKFCLLPDAQGQLRSVLAGVTGAEDVYALDSLPQSLPPGVYRLDDSGLALDPLRAALGWGLGAYRFSRYRKSSREPARLVVDRAAARAVAPLLGAVTTVRDLINTPTQ